MPSLSFSFLRRRGVKGTHEAVLLCGSSLSDGVFTSALALSPFVFGKRNVQRFERKERTPTPPPFFIYLFR